MTFPDAAGQLSDSHSNFRRSLANQAIPASSPVHSAYARRESDYYGRYISSAAWQTSPALMRNSRLGDPLDPYAKALAAVTSKRLKTEADHLRISELEFHGSLYLHHGAPCLPQNMIKSVCVDGAKKSNMGETTKAAFRAEGAALLQFDGPKTAAELWAEERFRHRAVVRIRSRGTLTVRTRPIFDGWSAVVHGTYLPSLLDRKDIVEFDRMAGLFGLCDFTPEFGRFQVGEVSLE